MPVQIYEKVILEKGDEVLKDAYSKSCWENRIVIPRKNRKGKGGDFMEIMQLKCPVWNAQLIVSVYKSKLTQGKTPLTKYQFML